MLELTIERLFSEPDLSGRPPLEVKFSPDARLVTFLQASAHQLEQQDLWCCRLADGEITCLVQANSLGGGSGELSAEDKAARERRRISQRGIIEYLWHPDSTHLLFPLDGVLFIYDIKSASARQLTPPGTVQTDARFSPDGRFVSFVRSRNLFVINLDSGTETQLTFDASETISNGLPEFIAQEEMHRFEGYWWSPDSTRLAFLQVDESTVDLTHRFEIEADNFGVFAQRYPFAGRPNAAVRPGLVNLKGEVEWLDLARSPDSYLARVDWLADGSAVAIQVQSRNQQQLDLVLCRPGQAARVVLTETCDTWINLNDHFRSLPSGRLLWGSERSGFCHLYLLSADGTPLNQVTRGDWVVLRVCGVDETSGSVYFEGYADSPLETHLYVTALDGSGMPTRLTRTGQTHQTRLAADFSCFTDRYASPHAPTGVAVCDMGGVVRHTIFANSLNEAHAFFPYISKKTQVSFGVLTAPDGHELHYRLIQPPGASPTARVPAIVTVYGGPGVQRVTRDWLPPWYHYMAARGYALFALDNRGSSGRGRAFESVIFQQLGVVEVLDQMLGARFLQSLPWVDAGRLGVFGHSYGGYLTLMLMMKSDGLFRAGVSVAPVTDWHLYDTHYTERFLGAPSDNVAGYEQSSVFPHVKNLSGALLLIHGMADDNVLFTHTTKLLARLQADNVGFEFMAYPGAKHGITGRTNNIHRYSLMDEFFARHLGANT
ncbi:MAG: DPP IV N-terminal domain-containing protein [Pseudomonadota bacterium]